MDYLNVTIGVFIFIFRYRDGNTWHRVVEYTIGSLAALTQI
jgi:hypothetical protein